MKCSSFFPSHTQFQCCVYQSDWGYFLKIIYFSFVKIGQQFFAWDFQVHPFSCRFG